jgi:nitrogen fixation protein NifU and related proteins
MIRRPPSLWQQYNDMDRQGQIEFLLDHYENPRHKEPLEGDGVVMVEGGNPGCGDVVRIYLSVNDDGKAVVTFEGEGCTISQASASYLSEFANGKTLDELAKMNHNDLIDALGREIVTQRTRCATLSLDTLRAAIRKRERELVAAQIKP